MSQLEAGGAGRERWPHAEVAPGAGLLVQELAGAASVSVRRFGDGFQPVGSLNSGPLATLAVKPDLAPEPWHVQIRSSGALTVCG